jgi:hypothetical protein
MASDHAPVAHAFNPSVIEIPVMLVTVDYPGTRTGCEKLTRRLDIRVYPLR